MKEKNKKELRKFKTGLTAFSIILFSFFFVMMFSSCAFGKKENTVILLAGDSRSSDDYTFYKETLEKKTGAEVFIEGASGMKAEYNASEEYLKRVTQKKHDVSIWLVGGNDEGSEGTIGTFSEDSALGCQGEALVEEVDINGEYNGNSFIQAVDYSMRKYKKMCADNYGKKAPVMIYCTDLPQQRDSADSEWSKKENWERKRLAILECCEKNDIECLDLYELCDFDMSIEPMFVAPTDKVNNHGVYYMDGLHPNPKGIDLITDFEVMKLKEIGILE
ncbi:MAG: hypothetical protein K5776_06785 [Lachnospiraceae bacterium]|nr:hypothetical protein [Lachnospiraceae bacterium]